MKTSNHIIILLCMCVLYACSQGVETPSETHSTKQVIARSYDRKCSVFAAIPEADKHKKEIVFIGHSLVNEFLVDEFMPHDENISYVNMGIGGDDVRGMYARRDLAYARNPYKIVCEIGVNDLLNKEPQDTIMFYYTQFIQETVSHNIRLIVCSVIPSNGLLSEQITLLNQKLNQVCKDAAGCIFVNMSGMADESGALLPEYDCGDHIHLSGKGYLYWSNTLKPYIYE